MSKQPTPGDWYADLSGDQPRDDVWTICTRRVEGVNGPNQAIGWRLAPVLEDRRAGSRRKPDEERANAYLFAASKKMARALLALLDSRTMTGKAFHEKWGQDLDPWEYAAVVIAKAKGED